jgi:hypothetical protein
MGLISTTDIVGVRSGWLYARRPESGSSFRTWRFPAFKQRRAAESSMNATAAD